MLLVLTLHSNGKIDLNSDGATGRAVELIHGPDPDRSPLREVASRVHEAGRSLPSDLQEVLDRADHAGLARLGFTHVLLATLEHPTSTRLVPIVAPAEPLPIGDLLLADLYSIYRDGSRMRAGIDCYEMMPVGNPPIELLVIGFAHVEAREPTWPRAASGLAIVATGRRVEINREASGWNAVLYGDDSPRAMTLETNVDLERVIAWTRGA